MAGIILPGRFTSQPQYPARIALGHPINALAKPVVVTTMESAYALDRINGDASVPTGPTNISGTVGAQGRGQAFVGNTTTAMKWARPVTTIQQVTFAAVFVWRSGGGTNNFTQLIGTSTTNAGFRVGSSLTGGGDVALTKGGVIQLTTVSLTSGVPYFMVASHDTVSGTWYLKLRDLNVGTISSASGNNTSSANTGDGNVAVGGARTDFAGGWNGDIFLGYVGQGFLPSVLADAWLQNSWQIFQAPARLFAVGAAAAGGPRGIFLPPNLNGLGSGGSFFGDRLAA